MSLFAHLISPASIPAIILAIGSAAGPVSRAVLRHRAGSAALGKRSEDQRREAGLEVIKELTRENEPWYAALFRGRKPDEQS